METKLKIGIVGTGLIARGLSKLLPKRKDMVISKILTRRLGTIDGLGVDQSFVTRNRFDLFDNSDLIIVSTGDPIYSTEIINDAFVYNLPVLTMDADTQVLTGSWFLDKGLISEGNGDQPGCLAVLKSEIEEMGFQPLVYGNIKGYLNTNPSEADMLYWAKKQKFSLSSVTSFTDGTKLQIEQALVANGLGAEIKKRGLVGIETENFELGCQELAKIADESKAVLADYIVSKSAPPGVFIMSKHYEDLHHELQTYKMGSGPYYLSYKPVHLCFFEVFRDIKELYFNRKALLTNGKHPSVSVAAVAKKKIKAGTFIKKGIGSFEVRGEATSFIDKPDHLPIGLMHNVVLKNTIEAGQIITLKDVDIPETLASKIWFEILKNNAIPPQRNGLIKQTSNYYYQNSSFN